MVFSSIIFLFYFLPVFLLVYFLLPSRFKNTWILFSSICFYAWGAPRFIFVILGTTLLDFYLVRLIYAQKNKHKRLFYLCISLAVNLGLLFYFKYCNFFITNINEVMHHLGMAPIPWVNLVLPIGISFYTFETITYVVDVYKNVHPPLKKFWDYQLYIIFFPKLIAGPIIRFHDFADQIYDHTQFETIDNRLQGFYRFCIGLAKKVMIANVLGQAATNIFSLSHADLDTFSAWCGALSYTFQIYFDFSGYSDMAIGLSQIMGFRIPENFNNPYTATSITDFWRRWHISLGNWMRNYLYIPLGGNRVNNKFKLYFNLWIVFLASGLWHGAAWGFIIWGAYHGFFLVVERIFLQKFLNKLKQFAVCYTFPVVLIGWVFFKLEHWSSSVQYIKVMFTYHAVSKHYWVPNKQWLIITLIATIFSFFTIPNLGKYIQDKVFFGNRSMPATIALASCCFCLLWLSAGYITISTFNPFIYFRF